MQVTPASSERFVDYLPTRRGLARSLRILLTTTLLAFLGSVGQGDTCIEEVAAGSIALVPVTGSVKPPAPRDLIEVNQWLRLTSGRLPNAGRWLERKDNALLAFPDDACRRAFSGTGRRRPGGSRRHRQQGSLRHHDRRG